MSHRTKTFVQPKWRKCISNPALYSFTITNLKIYSEEILKLSKKFSKLVST